MTATPTSVDVGARIAERIAKTVGPRRYAIWFDHVARFDYRQKDQRLRVAVLNDFYADRIGRQFGADLRQAAAGELGQTVAVDLEVDPQYFATSPLKTASVFSNPPSKRRTAVTDELTDEPRQSTDRLRHRLEQLVIGPSNELAYAAAVRLAEDQPDAVHPLFLHGGCGVGKTHLLQGICGQLKQNHPHRRVLYTTGEQFTNAYITAVRTKGLDRFRSWIRGLDLLAMDDVQFIASRTKTQEEFLHSFEHIHLSGARVVLASDTDPRSIKEFSDALSSRCVAGLVVRIDAPDTAMRLKLIDAFAKQRQLRLREGVAEELADRCVRSVREIEGVVTKLHAMATLGQRSSPLEPVGQLMLRRLFDNDFRSMARRRLVRFETILQVVSSHHGLSQQEIIGSGRHRVVVLARSILVHLARRLTTMSYTEIALAMGRRKHSTIITADKRLQRQIDQNEPTHVPGEPDPIMPARLVEQLHQQILHMAR